uniref:Uncharacterized protein n=1 Tax=Anguilla anguilla TaxID=7936 RepID=A0A0E9PJ98_ANGAN
MKLDVNQIRQHLLGHPKILSNNFT